MPELPKPPPGQPNRTETKTRGANRSTKVAGKLKVLPEQPEDLLVLPKPPQAHEPPSVEHAESSVNTGDSEDGDVEENEEDVSEEDVEVRIQSMITCAHLPMHNSLGV